jgi:hypothetical protein
MLGIETRDVGLATRFERMALWIVGLFTAHLSLALWALAILNNTAALQRMWYVVGHAHGQSTKQTPDERGY